MAEKHIHERIRERLVEIDNAALALDRLDPCRIGGRGNRCLRLMSELRKERKLLDELRSSLLARLTG